MKYVIIKIMISLAIFIMSGCVDTGYNPDGEIDKVWVIGCLFTFEPVQQIRIVRPDKNPATNAVIPITDAVAFIRCGADSIPLLHTDTGMYTCSLTVQAGKSYYFEASVKNVVTNVQEIVYAETVVPNLPNKIQIADNGILRLDDSLQIRYVMSHLSEYPLVNFSFDGDPNGYYIYSVTALESEKQIFDTIGWIPQYSWQFKGNKYHFDILWLTYFGQYTFTIYAVNPEYNHFIESQQFQTTTTNVHNGYGIFTAMSADSTTFTVVEKQ